MEKTAIKVTVFFDEPFWTGVFERREDERLSAAKYVFGVEPKDNEVLSLISEHYYRLSFGGAADVKEKADIKNPKRMQRAAKRQMQAIGIGTKAQQAIKQQRDEMKNKVRQASREMREAEKERLFQLKQKKKREKRKGR